MNYYVTYVISKVILQNRSRLVSCRSKIIKTQITELVTHQITEPFIKY